MELWVHRLAKKVPLLVINFKINKALKFSFNSGNKAANRISGEKKEQGFDCILSTKSDEPVRKMVYWEPGACIALGIVILKSCKECSICMDYYTSEMGFTFASHRVHPCPAKGCGIYLGALVPTTGWRPSKHSVSESRMWKSLIAEHPVISRETSCKSGV